MPVSTDRTTVYFEKVSREFLTQKSWNYQNRESIKECFDLCISKDECLGQKLKEQLELKALFYENFASKTRSKRRFDL